MGVKAHTLELGLARETNVVPHSKGYITSLHSALEKYMNFNKRGFKQLAAVRLAVALTQCSKEREPEVEEDKGKAGGVNSV